MKDHAEAPATLALSETLARYAAGFEAAAIPASARERARLLMLDSIGIALASHGDEFSRRALTAIGHLDGGGTSVGKGSSGRMGPRNAAHPNRGLIHRLASDDTP